MANLALVTGASSGIGRELARIHAAHGDVILVARRKELLESLRDEIATATGRHAIVLPADLADPEAAEGIVRNIAARGLTVDVLINNAGFGGLGRFHERDWARDHAMVQVNITAALDLARRLLPGMVERGHGRILNVSSVAGFVPGPRQSVYYATKAFLLSWSEALAEELRGTGVTVTALCPGPVATEFGAVAQTDTTRLFKTTMADAVSVAACGYRAMLRGKVIAVPGVPYQLLTSVFLRLMPRWLVRRLSRRAQDIVTPRGS